MTAARPRSQRSSVPSPGSVSRAVDTFFEAASDATEAARDFLVSEQGRRFRRGLATAIIVSAPLLSELPVIRRSPIAKMMRTAAVGALLVKGAEWLRDWEPAPPLLEPADRS